MNSIWNFITFLNPYYDGKIDSICGCFIMIGMIIMTCLYVARAKNRRYIRKFLGFPRKADLEDPPNLNKPYKMVIIWHNVMLFGMCHLTVPFAVYLFIFVAKWKTIIWVLIVWQCTFFSIPGGSHRPYSHRSFKASKGYQVVIMLLNCMLMQNSIIQWARDHRCHHKFVDTDADPYNPKRGLFFAHIGWLCVERHPEVIRQGRKIDMSDLTSNPILAFQQKYYSILIAIFNVIVPIGIPMFFWNERFWTCWLCCVNFAWFLTLTGVGCINSLAHSNGNRPYNKNISPADGVGPWHHLMTVGEGDHNFHHTFPQDYRSSEYNSVFLLSTHAIDLLSWFGLTWGLKRASKELIERRKMRNMEQILLDY